MIYYQSVFVKLSGGFSSGDGELLEEIEVFIGEVIPVSKMTFKLDLGTALSSLPLFQWLNL